MKKMIINNIESIHANLKHDNTLQIFILQEMHQSAEVLYIKKSLKIRIIINYKEEMIIKSEHKTKSLEQRLTWLIFKKFWNFRELFQEKKEKNNLIHHKNWDHKIFIIKEKKSIKQSIYWFDKKQLQELKKYIKMNLKKEYI